MKNKEALLIINLGSPDSPSVKDVRRYLGEFLMDERVIDLPYWKRWLLVKGIILQFRPKKSAAAYRSIWWKEGSPLIVLSKRLHEKVQQKSAMPVGLAMRYGSPSIAEGVKELLDKNPGLGTIKILPLYPQYAMSTYETVEMKIREVMKKLGNPVKTEFIPPFYNHPDYIEVLAESIRPYLKDEYDRILFSYHGIPERHIRKTDITRKHCLQVENCCQTASVTHEYCYRHQCYETTRLVCEKLGIPADKHIQSFQSRLGRDPWLQPYTDATLAKLGKEKTKRLLVVCPAFVSDCLETLEEIQEEGLEIFKENGGGEFTYIPCLNDRDDWAELILEL